MRPRHSSKQRRRWSRPASWPGLYWVRAVQCSGQILFLLLRVPETQQYLFQFSGLFYDGVGNEIGTEMAFMEANRLNVAAAVAELRASKEV